MGAHLGGMFYRDREAWERRYLLRALVKNNYSVMKTANELGMNRTDFYRVCLRVKIDLKSEKIHARRKAVYGAHRERLRAVVENQLSRPWQY